MKKLILTLSAVVLAASVQAQGTIWLNNYDANFGIFQGVGNTSAAAGTFVQVLAGSSAGSLTPVVATAGSFPGASTFTVDTPAATGGAFFDANFGAIPSVAASGTAYIEILTWSGAASYAAALTTVGAWAGASTIWSQTIGTTIPAPPSSPTPATLLLPGRINEIQTTAVPEPGTLALFALGGAALLIRRRK